MRGTFMPVEGREFGWRTWFHRLVNARRDPVAMGEARDWLLGALEDAAIQRAPETAFSLPAVNATSAIPFNLRKTEKIEDDSFGGNKPNGSKTTDTGALLFDAPLALIEGAWLQSLATSLNGHRQEVADMLAAYLALLGPDEAESPASAFRGRLQRLGVCLPPVKSWRFAHDPRIGLPAIRFSCLQLALGWHSGVYFAEALGFTLAYLRSGSAWRLPCLPETRRRAVLEAMDGHAQAALEKFLADGGEWSRVRRGYAMYQNAEADYLAGSMTYSGRECTTAEQVAGIFSRKLRFARGYHKTVKLGDRCLDEWFAETPFDAEGFLAAFAASPYARGESGGRPFERLSAFGGPMFGVFDREEIATIGAWLDGTRDGEKIFTERLTISDCGSHPPSRLQEEKATAHIAGWKSGFHPLASPDRSRADAQAALAVSRFVHPQAIKPNRELFHRLINNDADAETLAFARRRVDRVLAGSRRFIRKKGFLGERDFAYSPQSFALRIAEFHEREVARHKAFQPPPKIRRAEYVWGIRQFAPAILVDGCWLQHLGEAANQDSRVHRLLYRIYAEELGEGRSDWNHPRIYRDLLDEQGIDLPQAHAQEFASDSSLLDSAFDLPGYLLAISQFPEDYLPEILGLSLAIELSGLGAGYLRLAEELRYWKIDPLIVTLHLSIDNLAGGHAAMAAEAVELYLDEIRRLAGEAATNEAWGRVLCGYLSLEAAARRFKWSLIFSFLGRFLPGRMLAGPAIPA